MLLEGASAKQAAAPLAAASLPKLPRWRKVEPLIKSYLGNTLHLLGGWSAVFRRRIDDAHTRAVWEACPATRGSWLGRCRRAACECTAASAECMPALLHTARLHTRTPAPVKSTPPLTLFWRGAES